MIDDDKLETIKMRVLKLETENLNTSKLNRNEMVKMIMQIINQVVDSNY
jgi:hypothetical protein